MKHLTHALLGTALVLTLTTGAAAEALSKVDYQAGQDAVAVKLKAEKESCKSLAGNAKDICVEEAKGRSKVSLAELLENYASSEKHRYALRMAKADATYAVAKERCDDLAGNVKDVCRKEAKSVFVAAKADAKVVEKSNEANTTAREKKADARNEAAVDKSDAAYAVAKEKCDALANEAKTSCMNSAKTFYGKP